VVPHGQIRFLSTGQTIALDLKTGQKPAWTEISFPTRWHYDILWGLDYLLRAGVAPALALSRN
jgi:hypothetical protein